MGETQKIILGLETSCDDTSVSLVQASASGPPHILACHTFDQEEELAPWGGVVPEIAARNHLDKLAPLLEKSFKEAKMSAEQVDFIGVTTHPGLLGPLLTGLNAAKTLCLIHHTPIVPVNHLYAHIEAIHLVREIPYPYLGLIVSGGHSLFVLAHSQLNFEILGTTVDDAAGEAFDKGGKLLGLPYPAGKHIDQLGAEGDRKRFSFPVGLANSANADLSFSGLKTSLRNWIQQNRLPASDGQIFKDLCASYQEAIVQALKLKTRYALTIAHKKVDAELPLVVGGGVACNCRLREVFSAHFPQTLFVPPEFCTDNAAMIANYAWRTSKTQAVPFPEALSLDARGRFIDKKTLRQRVSKRSAP